MPLEAGIVLDGKYRVEEIIGRGGFGHVYRAREQLTGETLAIKELVPTLVSDPQIVQRFIQEARATLRLTHPKIARTYSVFQDKDTYYLAMEYLSGGSLADWLLRGSLPTDKALRVVMDLATALEYAHGEGVIHCDIKPANVLFDAHGQARLADFGIAHVSEQLMTRVVYTSMGTAMGTVRYMAPEQLEGVRDDPRLDIYALGTLLYEMLAGRPYLDFETETTPAAQMRNVQRIQNDPPHPLREKNANVPEWLDRVTEQALRKSPDERFATVEMFRIALQRGEQRPPRPETASAIRGTRDNRAPPGPLGLTLPNGEVVALKPGALTIGRNRDCDIVLDDIQVSRNHATIRITDGGAHLADVGSTNGTFVNGERVLPQVTHRLQVGDTVRLGQTATLSVGAGPVAAPTPVGPQVQPEPVRRPAAIRPVAQPQSQHPERELRSQPRSRKQPGWTMWLWWVLATVTGRALGRIASDAIIRLEPLIDHWSKDWPGAWAVFGAAIWTAFGLVLGLAQWLVLRPWIRRASWWVAAFALGNGIGHLLGGLW